MLSHLKKHDVVISGVAGLYPESDDTNELWNHLMSETDMVTIDGRRWFPGEIDVPAGTGKVKHPEHFDMTFFGIHRRLCEKMDPYTRHQCEQAYRAICDAGINPRFLDGTNTAVIVNTFSSEPSNYLGATLLDSTSYNVLAFSMTMVANRISYFLNLTGPSFQMDNAGVGGIQAIRYACDLISTGLCSAAIVGSSSLLYKPEPSFHYQAMGRLSEDSATRSFSSDASGYARSEACVALFLQRKDFARRIYGTILAADVNSYGSKPEAYADFPETQYEHFLRNMYMNANVNPEDVGYVEACGAASSKLDALELNSLSKVFLEKRKDPLLIGSVKSNLGHTEGSSSMVSLTKVLLTLQRGIIPPNLYYKQPNPNVPDLVSGKLKVVTEPTTLTKDIVGLTDISFTGMCSHMILRRHLKVKPKNNIKETRLPFLVTMSGRGEEALDKNMQSLVDDIDEEFTLLLNSLYKDGIKGHLFRGYTVVDHGCETDTHTYRMIGGAPSNEVRPVWFMYSGMGSQWPMMAKSLMRLPIFAEAIRKCHDVLSPMGVNLLEIVTKDDPTLFDNILNCFVGIAAVQIGLTDVLRAVGVKPDGIIGHSVGELGCAYADECLTAEQMILAAHARGRASREAVLIKGMMAAVGKGYNAIKNNLPDSIEVACHNSKDSCTLSGPAEDMAELIAHLKAKGIFAKLVNVANIAYHSRYIKPAAPSLLKYLKEIIPEPKKRSTKWVSSSNLEADWNSELAEYCSAEYHTNNLLSSVLFEEATAHIPSNAIVIEIAPHGLLQAIVKKSLTQAAHIPLTNKLDGNNLMYFLGALGKIYLSGIPIDLQAFYPAVSYPVSRNTPSISPLIDWTREENFNYRRVADDLDNPSRLCKVFTVNKDIQDFNRMQTHKINNRAILPQSFYLDKIIHMYTDDDKNHESLIIENITFYDTIEISQQTSTNVCFKLLGATGNINVTNHENGNSLVQGTIKGLEKTLNNVPQHITNSTLPNSESSSEFILQKDIIEFMKSMGVEKDQSLISISDVSVNDHILTANANWNMNIGDFLCSLLSLAEFHESRETNILKLFHHARTIEIDMLHLKTIPAGDLKVEYNTIFKTITCEAIQISSIECKNPGVSISLGENVSLEFEIPRFVPYVNTDSLSVREHITFCTQLVLENTALVVDTIIKIIVIGNSSLLLDAVREVGRSLKYSGNIQISAFSSELNFAKQGALALLQNNVWLVFADPPSEEMKKTFALMKDGFILMPQGKNVDKGCNFARTIFECVVEGELQVLCSVAALIQKRQYELLTLNENRMPLLDYHLSKVGDNSSCSTEVVKTIIVWGEVDSIITVNCILNQARNLPNNHLLHFWLFVGKFPPVDAVDESFRRQIERGVKVNISVGGRWGSLRFEQQCVPQYLSSSIDTPKFYYPLSVVALPHFKTLGLNPLDSPWIADFDDLNVYDFVTSETMGVGSYIPQVKTFEPDSILNWEKPVGWTDVEAATFPFLYSLASYIIHHVENAESTNDNSILINRGLMPLSKALIALALYENMKVHVSVYGQEEKKIIMNMFPQIQSEYIYDCTYATFYVDVLRNSKGIYKVINNFEETKMVESCVKSVKTLGVLVFVNEALLNQSGKIGMLRFIDEIIATGASSEILINSGQEIKVAIKKKLQEALNKEALKPIDHVSSMDASTTNTKALRQLKSCLNKVIVDVNSIPKKDRGMVYLNKTSKCHVVIEGKSQTDLSLNILEWLLKRGSQRVILFFKQGLPLQATSLRLNSLRKQYRNAEISVRSCNLLSSAVDRDKFYKECSVSEPELIFFVGSGLKDKVEDFDKVLSPKVPNCMLICIGKERKKVCEQRQINGFPSLQVICGIGVLESIHHYLDHLVMNSNKIPVVLVNKYTAHKKPTEEMMAEFLQIPGSRYELTELLKSSRPKATFEEILTAGLNVRQSNDVKPIFIIPGLRPGSLRQFASQLFCPALEARFPAHSCHIDQMATDLASLMATKKQNMFTIVAEGWGCVLALHIAAKLEAWSKIVNVILLATNPATTVQWANKLLGNETILIQKYLPVCTEVIISKDLPWEQKLKLSLDNTGLSDKVKEITGRGLHLLRERLVAVVDAKCIPEKLKCKCHVVELNSQEKEHHGLENYLMTKPIIITKHVECTEDLINNEAASDVNSLHHYEYRDAANPPIKEFIGMNVVKKPNWIFTSLARDKN